MSSVKFYNTLLVITLFLFFNACDKSEPEFEIDNALLEKVDELKLPSLSACVFTSDSIVWQQSYGYQDIHNNVEIKEGSIYHIGSISKLFIVTAIMQLEEKELLDLDVDISTYLPVLLRNPYYPDVSISARMLLTHSAGIAWPMIYDEALGIWDRFPADQAPSPSEWIPDFLIPSGKFYNPKIWKNTKPGTFELYSNIGSTVLAYVVEQLSGQEFKDYCKTHIFTPLGMDHTSYNYADLDLAEFALPYDSNNEVHAPFEDLIYPSGNLKSNLQDLARFLMMYLNKGILDGTRIVSEESVDKMFSLQNESSGRCLIWTASFGNWIGHTGGLEIGFSSIAEIHPDGKTGYIIYSNTWPAAISHGTDIHGLVTKKAYEYFD